MALRTFDLRVPKTAELVAGQIRRTIATGELVEGDALPPEATLMEQFSISRPTLREAFRILESEGLVAVRRGARGGARVQVPSIDAAARYAAVVLQHRECTVSDLLEVRALVEAPAAGWLARRRDRVAVADRLTECLEGVDFNKEPLRFGEFNALLVQLTGNEALILITTMLEEIAKGVTQAYTRVLRPTDEAHNRRGQRARERVIEHIRSGDADEAERIWRAHLVAANTVLAEVGGTVIDAVNVG